MQDATFVEIITCVNNLTRVMTNALDPIQVHLGRRTIVGDLGLTYDTNTTMGHLFD